ncbi:hypothetical protein T440DRAFT_406007 [Plenodomus tracheiphilus IPT5]|uniref:Uncharacterized protein n=1 Tax=Plenodomus tracheiphilus IPT5 TaxID=1408161 RepID=A0A6A7AT87_9PLEO|nr:hypothetical protein T440DRAFT_406007 [Plenodomus tracheiphilus IPT5]
MATRPTRPPPPIPSPSATPSTQAITEPHLKEQDSDETIRPQAHAPRPRVLVGELPPPVLRRIIFGHLDSPESRSALVLACPSVVVKAVRREPIVPIVQVDAGWPFKRLQVEVVLAQMAPEKLVKDAAWWRKVEALRRAEMRG